jgi:hypothetical protein
MSALYFGYDREAFLQVTFIRALQQGFVTRLTRTALDLGFIIQPHHRHADNTLHFLDDMRIHILTHWNAASPPQDLDFMIWELGLIICWRGAYARQHPEIVGQVDHDALHFLRVMKVTLELLAMGDLNQVHDWRLKGFTDDDDEDDSMDGDGEDGSVYSEDSYGEAGGETGNEMLVQWTWRPGHCKKEAWTEDYWRRRGGLGG